MTRILLFSPSLRSTGYVLVLPLRALVAAPLLEVPLRVVYLPMRSSDVTPAKAPASHTIPSIVFPLAALRLSSLSHCCDVGLENGKAGRPWLTPAIQNYRWRPKCSKLLASLNRALDEGSSFSAAKACVKLRDVPNSGASSKVTKTAEAPANRAEQKRMSGTPENDPVPRRNVRQRHLSGLIDAVPAESEERRPPPLVNRASTASARISRMLDTRSP
jgi:hypothetical protein